MDYFHYFATLLGLSSQTIITDFHNANYGDIETRVFENAQLKKFCQFSGVVYFNASPRVPTPSERGTAEAFDWLIIRCSRRQSCLVLNEKSQFFPRLFCVFFFFLFILCELYVLNVKRVIKQ